MLKATFNRRQYSLVVGLDNAQLRAHRLGADGVGHYVLILFYYIFKSNLCLCHAIQINLFFYTMYK